MLPRRLCGLQVWCGRHRAAASAARLRDWWPLTLSNTLPTLQAIEPACLIAAAVDNIQVVAFAGALQLAS